MRERGGGDIGTERKGTRHGDTGTRRENPQGSVGAWVKPVSMYVGIYVSR